MTDRRHLRPVGEDERAPEKAGSLAVVIDDLEVAHGHVVEARAELAECPQPGAATVRHELMSTEATLAAAITVLRDDMAGP